AMHAQESDVACRVELREWDADWQRVAEHVLLCAIAGDVRPQIKIYAFSWGAGWGFLQLARRLRERGLEVDAAVLSDPVYRSPLLIDRWRSLVGRPKIVVPDNVHQVDWFYQRTNTPHGGRVVALDPKRTDVRKGKFVR